MKDPTELDKAKLDLLAKEYDHRFSEDMFHSERYHRQVSFLQLYIATLFALSGVLFSSGAANFLEGLRLDSVVLTVAYAILLILGTCLAFYLVANLLDALFMTYINDARLSALEQRINDIVDDKTLLAWDTKIIPKMYSIDFRGYKAWAWIRPQFLVGVWAFLIFLALVAILSALCYALLPWGFFLIFSPVVLLLTLFHSYQVYILNDKIAGQLRRQIFELSGLRPDEDDKKSENEGEKAEGA